MARKPDVQYIQYYTGGSAAPQLVPQRQKSKTRLPKAYKRQSYTIHVDPLALGGILVSVVMLVLMVVGMVQLQAQKQQLEIMEDYVQELRTENARLTDTYESGYDLELVEQAALSLGMVPRDQVKHITVDMPEPVVEEPTTWQRFTLVLKGLFA